MILKYSCTDSQLKPRRIEFAATQTKSASADSWKIKGLKPTEVGFACVDAVSNRPFRVKLTPMIHEFPLPENQGLGYFLPKCCQKPKLAQSLDKALH